MTQDKAEQIRIEQDYFDHAWDAHERSRNADNPTNWTVGAAADRRAMNKHIAKKTYLGPEDAVAERRFVKTDGKTLYVGKVHIRDEDSEPLVISWNAPAAAELMQASVEEPGEVASTRTYDCDSNRVLDFDERVFADLAEKVKTLTEQARNDDALLKALEKNRTGEMRDIVKTIQASQDKLVRADPHQLLIIQGGPGTGKTAVALHRVSWMLYAENKTGLRASDVLVVGPNPAFTKYIKRVLPSLGDEHVKQTSIEELLVENLSPRAVESDQVAKLKGKSEMAFLVENALNQRIGVPKTPLRIARRNSAARVTIAPETIAEDIKELRGKNYNRGRRELKARLLNHCAAFLNLRRGQSVADFMEPASVNAALDRMWPQLSSVQFVRELYGSRARLKAAAEDMYTAEELELLYRPAAVRISDEPWTLEDLAVIDCASSAIADREELWGHIVVDEAQDLSPMQLQALRRRSRNGAMTIMGDIAQSTGAFSRDSWTDIRTELQRKLGFTYEELEHGYRVPKEVYDVAAALLPIAAPDITPPTIIRKVDERPRLFDVGRSVLTDEIAQLALEEAESGRFVGVVALPELLSEIRSSLQFAQTGWASAEAGQLSDNINLVTPVRSKGLEFDSVIVIDPEGILEEDPRGRQLYIALTRTTERLTVVCPNGEIPDILRPVLPEPIVIDSPEAMTAIEEAERIVEDAAHPDTELPATDENADPASKPVLKTEPNPEPAVAHVRQPQVTPGMIAPIHGTALQVTEKPADPLWDTLVEQNAKYLITVMDKMFKADGQKEILEAALELIDQRRSTSRE